MLDKFAIIRDAADVIASAADRTCEDLGQRLIEHEPSFTDRLLARIADAVNQHEKAGVKWRAKTLTSNVHASQESRYGADFAGVLELDLPGYRVKKGFLAQAKRVEPESLFEKREYGRTRRQCETMLKLTPHAYLFLYSKRGVKVVPALAVVSSDACNPHRLYPKTIKRFFEAHFSSFIGDRRLVAPSIEAIKDLEKEYDIRRAIYLAVSKQEKPA